ncbi:BlaI/MecI/CopY family transcriptional regulator [Parvularcula sp. LCG005]|uniref:BlaI/MecI/CopY family transcriptional regulator n=1 Tax=Parvularcula sp. LCG005 TaxID=3078805 RepID=UPI00294217AD|nr:BlaI/MecI/CopY family transcriptional regulator [Parvularcula sp. LCG005]WOI54204.1 BlaI/MecI/CopY family transcriptional regulator [Parvularcula sp. LCG005]
MQISPAELEVMKVLWTSAPQTASDIAEQIGPKKDWSDRTVKTLLSRLVDKGALRTESEGRRYLYSPVLEQDAYQTKETGHFVDRLFGGRAAPLVAHLANDRGLDADDIAELEALLEELKNDR